MKESYKNGEAAFLAVTGDTVKGKSQKVWLGEIFYISAVQRDGGLSILTSFQDMVR